MSLNVAIACTANFKRVKRRVALTPAFPKKAGVFVIKHLFFCMPEQLNESA